MLEAKYKFSTDIFSIAKHSDRALQSFSLRQAIRAIFQLIWMDVQRTRFWHTINSSVKAHDSLRALFLTHKWARESYIPCRIDALHYYTLQTIFFVVFCCYIKSSVTAFSSDPPKKIEPLVRRGALIFTCKQTGGSWEREQSVSVSAASGWAWPTKAAHLNLKLSAIWNHRWQHYPLIHLKRSNPSLQTRGC